MSSFVVVKAASEKLKHQKVEAQSIPNERKHVQNNATCSRGIHFAFCHFIYTANRKTFSSGTMKSWKWRKEWKWKKMVSGNVRRVSISHVFCP